MSISPEQRLFEVIQKAKKPGRPQATPLKALKSGAFSLKKLFGGLKFPALHNWGGAKLAPLAHFKLQEISLQAVNKTLGIILACAVSFTVYYAVVSKLHYLKMEKSLLGTKFHPAKHKSLIETLKPIGTYLAQVAKRDIFKPAPKGPVSSAAVEEGTSVRLKEAAQDLKLEGISWGQDSKAMIMNTKENKMYFLSEGQPIGASGLEVKEIQRDKVVIGNDTEEIDLL